VKQSVHRAGEKIGADKRYFKHSSYVVKVYIEKFFETVDRA